MLKRFKRLEDFERTEKRYVFATATMGTLAAVLGTAAIGGLAAGSMGAFGGDKPQEPQAPAPAPALEAAPTPVDAQAAAQAEIEKKKRIRALAGGKTILTDAAPTLGGGGKTLLGS